MYYLGPGYSYVPGIHDCIRVQCNTDVKWWSKWTNSMCLAIKMNIQVIKRTKVKRNSMSLELTVIN